MFSVFVSFSSTFGLKNYKYDNIKNVCNNSKWPNKNTHARRNKSQNSIFSITFSFLTFSHGFMQIIQQIRISIKFCDFDTPFEF